MRQSGLSPAVQSNQNQIIDQKRVDPLTQLTYGTPDSSVNPTWNNTYPALHPFDNKSSFSNEGYYEFDGVDDYIVLDDMVTGLYNGSVSAWIYLDSFDFLGNIGTIFSKTLYGVSNHLRICVIKFMPWRKTFLRLLSLSSCPVSNCATSPENF